mmetsp:Transcript_1428/g.3232  ORF Transcript_1428/g.3232 Transcript_1428/m.3232 type:complete len:222 (-) Transcript_1428:2020-2685(-)
MDLRITAAASLALRLHFASLPEMLQFQYHLPAFEASQSLCVALPFPSPSLCASLRSALQSLRVWWGYPPHRTHHRHLCSNHSGRGLSEGWRLSPPIRVLSPSDLACFGPSDGLLPWPFLPPLSVQPPLPLCRQTSRYSHQFLGPRVEPRAEPCPHHAHGRNVRAVVPCCCWTLLNQQDPSRNYPSHWQGPSGLPTALWQKSLLPSPQLPSQAVAVCWHLSL